MVSEPTVPSPGARAFHVKEKAAAPVFLRTGGAGAWMQVAASGPAEDPGAGDGGLAGAGRAASQPARGGRQIKYRPGVDGERDTVQGRFVSYRLIGIQRLRFVEEKVYREGIS